MQDVGRTVAAHKAHIQPLTNKYPQLEIGAPAVTNGERSPQGTAMGKHFLKSFISECNAQGIKIDFVVAHWYDQWPNAPEAREDKFRYFKDHFQAIYEAGGNRKVWVTEFGVTSGDKIHFLDTVMSWMDDQHWIDRYAFHYATQGVLVTDDLKGLTSLGPDVRYIVAHLAAFEPPTRSYIED